ncbi:MAG TPA: glycosyltransferase family 4 protein [Solirubrobacteraceae bacterium]|nr:glycosyltransferase family 4 protein [Solirubrobacteraceae bacterium]
MAGSVLWLVHQPPLPAVSGARVRTLALIRELAARGWDVSLFALDTGVPAQPDDVAQLRELCDEVRIVAHDVPRALRMARIGADLLRGRAFQHSMFRSPQAVAAAHDWIAAGSFDAIVASGLYMLPYVPPAALSRTLLDSHNVDTERIATMAAALWPRPRGVLARVQQHPVRRHEERAAASVGGVLAVSAPEARWFERVAPGRVTLVANGVDAARVAPRGGTGAGGPVLFVGSLDYGANLDAAHELLDEIAPRLTHPGARIALVGALPPPELRAAAAAAPVPVEVTGRVAQIGPWFARSRLLVVPLRIGGGTRLKILEAMAHGLPVVTTSLGCAGLDVEHGRDVIVADDPADIARWVDRLLADDELAGALGARGRETVVRRYDWRTIGDDLDAALAALPARPPR